VKILIVRFSSIGDIVLTTPILRAIKTQLNGVSIHYLTKRKFADLLENNPHIDKLITIDHTINEVIADLKVERYDRIIDLHHNFRTLQLKLQLNIPTSAFPKLNIAKWILVNFKYNRMPNIHLVERYFQAVKSIGVTNDGLPCELYLKNSDEIDTMATFDLMPGTYVAIAIGAQFKTKQLTIRKLKEIIRQLEIPVILLGGKEDIPCANELISETSSSKVFSACGKYTILQSASIVKQSKLLLTHDTGLMHIASCFNKQIVSVWGNTVPAFGMYPYLREKNQFSIHEISNLSCRPCSKIGFQRCPKEHFKCMELQDSKAIAKDIQDRIEKN